MCVRLSKNELALSEALTALGIHRADFNRARMLLYTGALNQNDFPLRAGHRFVTPESLPALIKALRHNRIYFSDDAARELTQLFSQP
ncbi:MAG: hypothetical protein HJJLKODD_02519 [Phycisphaerae bacterium]|nr:hypothetical protein [Phycisphaerae bacterium]